MIEPPRALAPYVLEVIAMTKLLTIAILFTACNDSSSTATKPASATPSSSKSATAPATTPQNTDTAGLTGGAGQPSVDPTIPSWAPKSCVAYHKAVVQALECNAIDKTKRDQIQQAYGDASSGWKAEKDGTPARIEQVDAACERSTASVQSDTDGKCVTDKT